MWDDINIILAIGRAGSLSGAAKALKLNHSTVFRRINAIEKQFEVRFFDRLPSGYVLTEAGEMALAAAERIDNEVNQLNRSLLGKDLRLQGNIRLTAPEGVTLKLLSPHLAAFCKKHPDINLDVDVTGSAVKLSRREADIAVRVTTKPPDTSIGRKIGSFAFAMYASKSYLQKHKKSNSSSYDWLMMDDSKAWFPASVWKGLKQADSKTVFSSNSMMAVVNAAKEGMGVAPLPCFLGDSENKLIRVIQPQANTRLELWLLIHPDLRNTARVKALMQFLYEKLQSQSNLLEGLLP